MRCPTAFCWPPEPSRAKWYYWRDIRTYRELLAILACGDVVMRY